MKRLCWYSIALAGVLLSGIQGHAGTVVLTPSADNTLYQSGSSVGDNKFSNGGGQYMFAGKIADSSNDKNKRRVLIQFDLSSIPADANINSVSLTLRMSRTIDGTARNHTLHRLTASWGEGSVDAPDEEGKGADAETGDVTWAHRYFDANNPDGGTHWAVMGGEFIGAPSSTTSVGGNGNYTWTG